RKLSRMRDRLTAQLGKLGLQLIDARLLRFLVMNSRRQTLLAAVLLVGGKPTINDAFHHHVGVLLVDIRHLLALIGHGNGREARTLVRGARGGVFATELHKPKETRLIAIVFPLHPAGLLVLLGRELLGHGMRPHVEFGQPLLAERLKRLALGLERTHLALGGVELHKRPFALGQLVGRARLASAPVLSWFRPARHLGYLTGSMAARPFYLRPPAGAPARARHHYSF